MHTAFCSLSVPPQGLLLPPYRCCLSYKLPPGRAWLMLSSAGLHPTPCTGLGSEEGQLGQRSSPLLQRATNSTPLRTPTCSPAQG